MSVQRVILAEYFLTEDRALLFLVREDFSEPVVAEINHPLLDIRNFALSYLGGMVGGSGLDEAELQRFLEPFIQPLLLPSPHGDLIASPEDLVWFVPHDVLHYLPLHAVKLDGKYLIERNPVCYSPSGSVMKYCHAHRKTRRDRILVFADSWADQPLVHARVEAAALEELFRPGAEVYINGQATKSLLEQRLADPAATTDILHLACHGRFDDEEAMKSGIALASEPGHEGQGPGGGVAEVLTAEEFLGLRLGVDLVTLSACESGVNQHRPGDELIGLTRALIHAGTPSVLVSLWSVSDISTSILMTGFYHHLRQGLTKAEALRRAQVGLLELTASAALAYCREAAGRLGLTLDSPEGRLLAEDVANLQFLARDYPAAEVGYRRLQAVYAPSSPEYRSLKNRLARCRVLGGGIQDPPDYEVRVFTDLAHWAPFVLVGDWK